MVYRPLPNNILRKDMVVLIVDPGHQRFSELARVERIYDDSYRVGYVNGDREILTRHPRMMEDYYKHKNQLGRGLDKRDESGPRSFKKRFSQIVTNPRRVLAEEYHELFPEEWLE